MSEVYQENIGKKYERKEEQNGIEQMKLKMITKNVERETY